MQVFAFYLGCQAPEKLRSAVSRFYRTAPALRTQSANDPKTIDADMFQNNLESLGNTLTVLSGSLSKVSFAFLRMKSRIILSEDQKKDGQNQELNDFLETVEELKGEIMTNTSICGQRKEAVVTLMKDGFGERTWTFRTVKY